jgi:L-ascorbate metabolism protein UlaG (beta-lactamase superfamily)
MGDIRRWMRSPDRKHRPSWPKQVEVKTYETPPERVFGEDIQVTFINHSTVLIQLLGLNIITDPIWSERASPFSFIGPKRVKKSGVAMQDLPDIDIVLLSHNHYDHLDIPTLRKLKNRFNPRIFTGLEVSNNMPGIPCNEMDWWEYHTLTNGVKIWFVPAKHWSARWLNDKNQTLWGGFVIETSIGSIYFAGDTGYGSHFKMIAEKFPDIRLALLPIGAYKPEWFMNDSHTSPEESVQAFIDLKAQNALAIHFGTFRLSDEGYDDPIEDLMFALRKYNISPERFMVLDHGQGWGIPKTI